MAVVWGAQRRSCSWSVFVEQTAEQIASTNLARLILADNRQPSRSVRCRKPERSMRTMPVVVLDIDPQDLLQVALSYDQEPVQALGADRADPSLGVRVRPGRLHRRHQHLATFGAEHVVEAAGELGVPVAEQEAYPSPSLFQHQHQVAGLLGNPAAVGVGSHPGQVHPPGVVFDEEQHIQPPQPEGVDGEEVAGHGPGGLLARNTCQLPDARRGAGSSP
jgi:hypothetical protein